MRLSILIRGLLLTILILPFWGSEIQAAEMQVSNGLTIGRMRVMIWPEYDDPGTLVVYDGRFKDDSKFPTITDFLLPKDAVISDICSLSPGGQHFCQLYDVTKGEDYNIVHMSLPFSNFYVSFHRSSVDLDIAQRQIEYTIKLNHPVDSMEIDIQQPLRSSQFTLTPSGGEASVRKGFNHFSYSLEKVARGEDRIFSIGYEKQSREPSVDTKFASMSERRVWGSPYDTQRNVRTIIYIVFGTGIAMVLIATFWIVRSKRKKVA